MERCEFPAFLVPMAQKLSSGFEFGLAPTFLRRDGQQGEDLLEVEPLVCRVRVMVLRVVFCALILPILRECCISFSMTSYKRCDRLLNCEADFVKYSYTIYYNVIPYLLGLNVGKTKKVNSGRKFPKLMAR